MPHLSVINSSSFAMSHEHLGSSIICADQYKRKTHLSCSQSNSINRKQFHFKIKISVGWNDSVTSPSLSVAVIARNMKHCRLTQAHFHDAFVPSSNNFADANCKLKRTSSISTGIKFLTVCGQRAAARNDAEWLR